VKRLATAVLPLAACALALAGCGSGGGQSTSTGSGSSGPGAAGGASGPSAASGDGGSTAGATAQRLLGLPPVPNKPPLPGYMLIADRDNNRIIVVSPQRRVVWRFPAAGDLRPNQTFAGPDDAFLAPDGRSIVTNEEFADTIAEISLGRKPRIGFEYGHANAPGSSAGYLSHPDDAYALPNGLISVADIINCRVLYLDRRGRIVRSIGSAGNCVHDPPRSLEQPNGDTPLPDGGVLVTEIGGWVDRIDRHGHLVWSIRTPTSYPSDAQLLSNGNVLVAGFDTPGHIYELTPKGQVLWTYGPASGPGALDKPSLAVPLPHHMIAATDDYNERVVIIDRRTKRIVWQYGHTGVAGSGPGYLSKPDGLDLIR
jgi:hypothetical protein